MNNQFHQCRKSARGMEAKLTLDSLPMLAGRGGPGISSPTGCKDSVGRKGEALQNTSRAEEKFVESCSKRVDRHEVEIKSWTLKPTIKSGREEKRRLRS